MLQFAISKAQDVEKLYNNVTSKDSVRLNGGITANTTLYNAWGTDNRREPFFWTINGNMTLSYKLLKVPFSFQISKQQRNFTNPFQLPDQQFGISPTYKGYTAHLGYRSMQFSEFSLSGTQFLGVGFEVERKDFPWKFKTLYGRFAKAYDGDSGIFVSPDLVLYDRWGGGLQVTKIGNKGEYGVSFFKAKDDETSLSKGLERSLGTSPQENFVSSITIKQELGTKITLQGEYSASAYTRDIRTQEIALDRFSYLNNLNLFTPRSSSTYNSAYWLQGNFQVIDKITLNGKYRRVSPDYQSMGAIFLTNNIREISTGLSWIMFKDRITTSVNLGSQVDNLDDDQQAKTQQLIRSINITYLISKKLNTNINYSNFSSETRQAFSQTNIQADQDSLFFLQVTNNASIAINYATGENVSKNTSLTMSIQDASDNQGAKSKFYNTNISQQLGFRKTGTQLIAGFNFSQNENVQTKTQIQFGPSLTISQRLFKKKVNISLTNTYQQTKQGKTKESEFTNSRLAIRYTYKKHQLSANTAFLNRKTYTTRSRPFSEIRSGFNYAFNF